MAPEQFDDMPKIVLEKDDMESFQRSRGKASKDTSPTTESASEKTVPSANSPSWFSLIFMLGLVVAAMVYWSYEQQAVLQTAQNRIGELEGRLSATGEEMGESAVALQVKVTELSTKTNDLWQQMDRLWASAWRRNQADIEELSVALKTQGASMGKKLNAIQTDINGSTTSLGLLREQFDAQSASLNLVNGSSARVKQTITDLELQVEGLKEKLMSTALANNNLTSRIDDLTIKQVETEKELRILKASIPPPRAADTPEVF